MGFCMFVPLYLCCRAREALRQCLPEALKDQTFAAAVSTEDSVQRWLALLLKNLNDPAGAPGIATVPGSAAGAIGSGPAGASAAGAVGVGKGGAGVNLPSIPSGTSGAFGYSSVPLASANWNT